MINNNKEKLKKFIPLALFVSLIAISSNFAQSVHADSVRSNTKSSVRQWGEKKDVSTIKNWTIIFRTPIDVNSILKTGVITVTDSQGNLIDTKLDTDYQKCVYVEPPKEGYKEGQTYYLNISTDVRFRDESQFLKEPVQMKFTTRDIGTITIDENSYIAAANNAFGFNLMKNLINEDKNKNTIISPLSISTILSMTENGAEEETKQEMLNCIGLKGVNDKNINHQYYSLLDYYNNLKSVKLKSANSIWVNKKVDLNSDFKNMTKKYYMAQVNLEDFSNHDTLNKINHWVNQSTNGQIKKIIDDISKDDVAILVNSLYFNGKWSNEFLPQNTKKEEFTLSSGEKINVDNMEKRGHVNYLKGDNFEAISLPYYDGIEMNIFLPKEGVGIDKFIQSVSKEKFDKWMSSFGYADVIQQIPKFKMEYDTDLKKTLEALGMKQAFDAHKANFKKIANNADENPIYIGKVKHKACINVDEKGTEAAAITAVILNGSSAPADQPINFTVNRPFFFAIRDSKSGMILFMGKVENPSTDNVSKIN